MMKKLIYLSLLSLFTIQAAAQQLTPIVKVGTTIEERFSLYGQTVRMSITVGTMTDSVLLNWTIKGLATGSYLVTEEGFKKGTKINFIQPAASTVLKLAPDETFGLISKAAFAALKKNKQFVYNNTTYVLKDDVKEIPFKIGDQELDVLHVSGLEESGDLWILNDPKFPLICQLKNNPLGINFTVTGIK